MNIVYPADYASATIQEVLDNADSDILFLGDAQFEIEPGPNMFDRMAEVMRHSRRDWIYADGVDHPRIDYQTGSVRDTFDFGPVIAVSVKAARQVGLEDGLKWGGLYDLRLRLSERNGILRVPEPLYTARPLQKSLPDQSQFAYVDSRNRDYQIEMERVVTAHLRRIGAWLPPTFETIFDKSEAFPLKASIVVPVRDRAKTILDAIRSALSQRTDFEFDVIVVDNHSKDNTTALLRGIKDPRVKHLMPQRTDLGIGGCWNEAIHSKDCGEYVVQLDSDDLYSSEHTLQQIVTAMEVQQSAMLVGSYTIVDFVLNEIPPGLIDHREWTRENGRNNALRVNGLGAPRAFRTSIVRRIGFPNVSYGEDYAVGLRISRDYEIARLYDRLYLCRRWEGNSDRALPLEVMNRYDQYKDWIRSVEIAARVKKCSGR